MKFTEDEKKLIVKVFTWMNEIDNAIVNIYFTGDSMNASLEHIKTVLDDALYLFHVITDKDLTKQIETLIYRLP